MIDLHGKVALVTGGSRGIGRAIVLELARHGAEVIVNYVRHHTSARETVDAVRAEGGKCHLIKANLADADSMANMFAEIKERYSHLDILISNAASGVLKPMEELKVKHWDWAMGINARALLFLAQQGAPLMVPGGRIIAVSSIGAIRAIPNYTVVGASKAALESLVRHLAVELGPRGITINTISAGVVDTDALKKFPNRDELIRASMERTPLGRMTTPEDVADVVILLCSKRAGMIHGQVILVDGGYAIHG